MVFSMFDRDAWNADPSRGSTRFDPSEAMKVVYHWVGALNMLVAPSLAQSIALVKKLQGDAFANRKQKYVDIPYSFLFDPMGRIFEGRGWGVHHGANGDGYSNDTTWAFCYMAGPGVPLTDAAKVAMVSLAQEAARRGPNCDEAIGHRDVVPDECPGDAVYGYLPTVNAQMRLDSPSQPPKPTVVIPTAVKGIPVDLSKAKGQLVTLVAQPDGRWLGVLNVGATVDPNGVIATLHGNDPVHDPPWSWLDGGTIRAQAHGPQVLVTGSFPNWRAGNPSPQAHVFGVPK